MITGEQVRAARSMLRMNQKQFAELAHITVGAVQRFERTRGPLIADITIVEVVRAALESAGIEFIDSGAYTGIGGPGLRLKGEPVATDDIIDLESVAEVGGAPDVVAAPK